MKTLKEIVELINAAKLDAPGDVNDMDSLEYVPMKQLETIDPDEHCWYTIGTVVYKLDDGFIGVRGPVHLNSESTGWDDCCCEVEAFEMVEVPSVTYKRK